MPADYDDHGMGAGQADEAQKAAATPGPEPQSQPEPAGVEQLMLELEQTKAGYQRLAADFENYKRRKTQETQELARYGSAALLRAILPALDNLSRAVAHIDEDATDGLSEGLRLTLRQLEEALTSQGVQRIAAVGRAFDPRLHDAVATVPGEGVAADTVVAELLPGYQIHDRVVRPAQVSVAQPESAPPAPGPTDHWQGAGQGPAGDEPLDDDQEPSA